jgi:hypothetical protein
MSCVVLVVQASDEPIAKRSHDPVRCAATAGNPQVDLNNETTSRAADHSTGPPVTQRPVMLRHPTPEDGEALLFENSDEELDYRNCKNPCLE